jgi:Uma2 family endonuclease
MSYPAPTEPVELPGMTVERYFALVDEGLLSEDDRVELLEGVVVAMAPRTVRHDAGVTRAHDALRTALGMGAVIRVQCSIIPRPLSAPEPDVAVVPGSIGDYDLRHPTTALLIVEVSDSSLPQDRLTKTRIYAAAGIPEFWIVNLRDDQVEVLRGPEPAIGAYRERRVARPGERLDLVAFPGATVVVDDLLPRRPRDDE